MPSWKEICYKLSELPVLGRLFKPLVTIEKEQVVSSARMTHNRLQALEGMGYRECYMEKIKEVGKEQEVMEANHERWFPTPNSNAAGSGTGTGTASSTETPALSGRKRESTSMSRARITSHRLKAYEDSLPKSIHHLDEVKDD